MIKKFWGKAKFQPFITKAVAQKENSKSLEPHSDYFIAQKGWQSENHTDHEWRYLRVAPT